MKIRLYLFAAAVTIYLVRAIPIVLLRRELKNPFVRSFLYYVPYVTLAVMTFPAILTATGSMQTAAIGFLVGIVLSYVNGNLFLVAIGSCLAVYISEFILL